MKLQQLRYIKEVVQADLNISAAADNLFTSQPGISKQIRLLEDELGVQIFSRSGKHLTRITEAGEHIMRMATEILNQVDNIKQVGQEYSSPVSGSLSLATTHTQARYMLPKVIKGFIRKYPNVDLNVHQGTPMQISEMAANWQVDFAIATEALQSFSDLVMMPCYKWNRCILVKKDHPLAQSSFLTLEAIAQNPIVTYVYGFTGRSKLDAAFKQRNLSPRVVLTASDSDVIKTYVRLGLGVGIVAKMAYHPVQDKDLVMLEASHLFEHSVTKIGFRKGSFLRAYMYDFIVRFSPHLSKEIIDEAHRCNGSEELDDLFKHMVLPNF